jgi:hypothetical protein
MGSSNGEAAVDIRFGREPPEMRLLRFMNAKAFAISWRVNLKHPSTTAGSVAHRTGISSVRPPRTPLAYFTPQSRAWDAV